MYIASWLAAVLQLWVLTMLAYGTRGHPEPSRGGSGVEESFNVQNPQGDGDNSEARQEQKRRGGCPKFMNFVFKMRNYVLKTIN